MTERKSLLEQALDVCVYAPVGLAIAVTEELPQLIDKGRARVNSQLTMARMVGSFAVAQGQREAERVVKQATGLLAEGGRSPVGADAAETGAAEAGPWDAGPAVPQGAGTGAATDGGAPVTASPGEADLAPPGGWDGAGQAESDGGAELGGGAPPSVPDAAAPTPQAHAGDVGSLAIPGYDALSASQVVQRLAGLAPGELEAVRVYEAATRGRKTILSRIAQLQAPGGS